MEHIYSDQSQFLKLVEGYFHGSLLLSQILEVFHWGGISTKYVFEKVIGWLMVYFIAFTPL